MPNWYSLLYGTERLGHQTKLIQDRVNKVVTMVCVAVCFVFFVMTVASAALVMVAIRSGKPDIPTTEETTTEGIQPTRTSNRNKTRKSSPRAMVGGEESAPEASSGSRCAAPRLVHCSSNLTSLVRHHGWFYMPGAGYPGSCLEWTPGHLCADEEGSPGGYRYNSSEECAEICEGGPPMRECTQPLPLSAIYRCAHRGEAGRQWWFYDPVLHACAQWEHVCVYKSYPSMAACVRDCLPVWRSDDGGDGE
ncbi:uncharacterized protein LOC144135553 [Amblyomma americanum]